MRKLYLELYAEAKARDGEDACVKTDDLAQRFREEMARDPELLERVLRRKRRPKSPKEKTK
jgi:hypothetical protein